MARRSHDAAAAARGVKNVKPLSAELSLRQRAEGHAAARVDRFFSNRFLERDPDRIPAPEESIARFREFASEWNDPEHVDGTDFFGRPERPSVRITPRPGALSSLAAQLGWRAGAHAVDDLTFPSPHRVHFHPLEERYLRSKRNRIMRARRIRRRARNVGKRRPTLIVVHGYMGGDLRSEPLMWPTAKLLRAGFDLVFVSLPFHGARGSRRIGPKRWPGADLMWALEGFRQAIADLRALKRWLEDDGAPSVGVIGMSLGGFTTALLSTVEEELSLAMPFIPLASFADWSRDAGQLQGDEGQQAELYEAMEEAHALVSPFRRSPLVPGSRVLVAGGARDGVTPIGHARRLAEHFEAPLVTFHGGHIAQLGRAAAFDAMIAMARREAILP